METAAAPRGCDVREHNYHDGGGDERPQSERSAIRRGGELDATTYKRESRVSMETAAAPRGCDVREHNYHDGGGDERPQSERRRVRAERDPPSEERARARRDETYCEREPRVDGDGSGSTWLRCARAQLPRRRRRRATAVGATPSTRRARPAIRREGRARRDETYCEREPRVDGDGSGSTWLRCARAQLPRRRRRRATAVGAIRREGELDRRRRREPRVEEGVAAMCARRDRTEGEST
jgi:hypothetical protein